MTESEWKTAPIADLLSFILDNSAVTEASRSALRYDLSRKHMLLAYGILRRYWDRLNPQVQGAIEAWEPLETIPARSHGGRSTISTMSTTYSSPPCIDAIMRVNREWQCG